MIDGRAFFSSSNLILDSLPPFPHQVDELSRFLADRALDLEDPAVLARPLECPLLASEIYKRIDIVCST
jgi:hypothetical protein